MNPGFSDIESKAQHDLMDSARIYEAIWNRVELLKRWMLGCQVWNDWARRLMEEQLLLLHSGEWAECCNHGYLDDPAANAPPVSWWLKEAQASFTRLHFHFSGGHTQTFCPLPDSHPVHKQARLGFGRRTNGFAHVPGIGRNWYAIHLHLPGKELDFSGWLFPGSLNFTQCSIHGNLLLRDVVAPVELGFWDCDVQGHLDLQRTCVFWMFYANNLNVEGHLLMQRMKFFELFEAHRLNIAGNMQLQGALFAHAASTMVSGDVWLEDAHVCGMVDLRNAAFFNCLTRITGNIEQIRLAGAQGTCALHLDMKSPIMPDRNEASFCGGIHVEEKDAA